MIKHILIPAFSDSDYPRFWSKVNILGENDCWEWLAYRNHKGYGVFGMGTWKEPVIVLANRVVLTLELGRQIEDGMEAAHDCNNPPCCNPRHVIESTHFDNCLYRDSLGRLHPPIGEKNGNSKLTLDKVIEIRELYSVGDRSYRSLGRQFSVSNVLVREIVKQRIWKDVFA